MARIILASSSPRRKDLLSLLVDSFEIDSSAVEEERSGLTPESPLPPLSLLAGYPTLIEDDPQLWAWRKAIDVASSDLYRLTSCLVLGADTIVVSRERVLGKPRDLEDAHEMLLLLRGTDHYVITGFALLVNHDGETTMFQAGFETTRVVMRAFSEQELEGYVATGEPFDKAGAYALQGKGGKLVASVEGCATNVIGLPLCRVRSLLENAGAILQPYPENGYCAFCPSQWDVS